MSVLNAHAERKSVLEVEFMDEEGTGLGPSLEFYALVGAEFQKKSLGMWLSDDDKGQGEDQSREVNIYVSVSCVHIFFGRLTLVMESNLQAITYRDLVDFFLLLFHKTVVNCLVSANCSNY